MPLVMTTLLVLTILLIMTTPLMKTPFVMTTLLIMKHIQRPNGSPTMLKKTPASTKNHTKHRQSSTAIQNRTRTTLPLLMYDMLLCLY